MKLNCEVISQKDSCARDEHRQVILAINDTKESESFGAYTKEVYPKFLVIMQIIAVTATAIYINHSLLGQ